MAKIYLACPYTHPDEVARNTRVEFASIIAAKLMCEGHVVFSPITHGHHIADHLPPAKLHSHEFWMTQCLPMLEDCDWMMVVPLHGWRESRGVAEELGFALERMPVHVWQNAHPDFELLDDEELETLNYHVYEGNL